MTFAWPQLLWLLLIPAGWLVWELTRGRKAAVATAHPKILRAEVGTNDLSLVSEPAGPRAWRARPWLTLGLTFAIIALARPQWGRIEEPVFDQAREILLAIDLSRSMLSPDVKPSRLDRAKLLVQALLEKLKGERVGLIVFSGTAFLQSPLSSDYEILREFLPALGPGFLPEGGTNYRALIDTSLDAFGGSGAADRFLIILSDGEATDETWQARAVELKNKGVRVLGLGIGTPSGTMIPDGSGGFVKDARGAVVLSKLESGTLQNLANATGGVYRDASTWIDLAGLIEETVNTGRKGEFTEKNTVRRVDRFQWPLALALWCFLVSFYYEFPVRPRTRDIALRKGPGSPSDEKHSGSHPNETSAASVAGTSVRRATSSGPAGAAVFLLAGFFAGSCLTLPTQGAVKVSPPPASAQAPAMAAKPPAGSASELAASLGRIVGRLSKKDSLTASDAAELAHETLNWGRRVRESHAPVPPGPVNDALTALDELEARGNTLSDWAQLRKDLQALLEKPPEKQQQQQQQQQQQEQQQNSSDQQKQDQQKSDQKPQPDSPQDQKQQQQDQQNSPQKQPEQKPENKPSSQSAFGDMSKPPPPPGETQKVGGSPEKNTPKEQTDPGMALPMEKLEQLKNQDAPAQLFQMMQERSQAPQKKPQKDW